jgi:hypothetical protein
MDRPRAVVEQYFQSHGHTYGYGNLFAYSQQRLGTRLQPNNQLYHHGYRERNTHRSAHGQWRYLQRRGLYYAFGTRGRRSQQL